MLPRGDAPPRSRAAELAQEAATQTQALWERLSAPGVEPGLSRPQRDVLTTRRCGLDCAVLPDGLHLVGPCCSLLGEIVAPASRRETVSAWCGSLRLERSPAPCLARTSRASQRVLWQLVPGALASASRCVRYRLARASALHGQIHNL